MAVHKPAPRPLPAQPRRADAAPGPGKVRVGATIGERRALAAGPRVVQEAAPRGILQSARDIFAGKAPKVRHSPQAAYVTGRPESPLKAITKETSSEGLIPHGRAVAFLDHFLSRPRKT